MVLMTRNRTLLRLVRNAYQRAAVKADEILIVWSTRIYLDDLLLVMESACPIYLERVVEQLRIYIGEKPQPRGYFLWVRATGNPAGRWRAARKQPRSAPGVPGTTSVGR
jgi:hypothetical protein